MQTTSYIATPAPKNLTLAEATWQEFRSFLSRYQWAFDDPRCSPRAAEIVSALQRRGQKGSNTFIREDGWRYILRPLHAWAFEQAIANYRRIYYVSYGRQALLYFDIDLHCDWQTLAHGQEAQRLLDALLQRFCGQAVVFWSPSGRGINGYLKVDLQGEDFQAANQLFDRLEHALQRFLAFYKNLADFEIKGKIGFLRDTEYAWKQYGKLPIHKDWNFRLLEQFKSKPTVRLASLSRLCQQIEAQVPLDVLERHKALKISLGDKPLFDGELFLVTPAIEKALLEKHGEAWPCMYDCIGDADGNYWFHERYYRPGQLPLTEREWRGAQAEANRQVSTAQQQTEPPGQGTAEENARQQPPAAPVPAQPVKAPTSPLKINIKLLDLATEPDSFKRQKEALFRYARYLKRVPTVQEALKYVREQSLFTGPWQKNQARRQRRVGDILKFIARTFDPGKCAHGSVNVGKYDEWARKKFPNGLTGRTRSSLSEDGNKVDGQAIHVSPGFIAVFLSVCEYSLITNKNLDDSLPHHRAQQLWEALYAKGLVAVPFCARKWAACREEMVRHGLIVITDRDYSPGKAMKWALGPYFPFLGLWKGQKLPSLLGRGRFTRVLRTQEHKHNTLLRKQSPRTDLEALWTPVRAPP
jgi:hypothetical protein